MIANPKRVLIFAALRTVLLGGTSPLLHDLRTSFYSEGDSCGYITILFESGVDVTSGCYKISFSSSTNDNPIPFFCVKRS